MGFEQIKESVNKYALMVQNIYNPHSIYLFGSYAKGSANQESDIDIAVIFKGFNKNYVESLADLCKLTIGVDTRIEPKLLDIQEDNMLLDEVLTTGVQIK